MIGHNHSVSLRGASNLIKVLGHKRTFLFEGETGIGKSAIFYSLMNYYGDKMGYNIIDCTTLDVGDIQMPRVVEMNGMHVTVFAPNHLLGFQDDKPQLIMFDELGKALQGTLNGILPILQEHRQGMNYLPEGSLVFATTNCASDGLMDTLKAHQRRRIVKVLVRKPHAGIGVDENGKEFVEPDSWLEYALDNDIAPEVIMFVRNHPDCLESYLDGSDSKRIFNPSREPSVDAFVCPFTLEVASDLIKTKDQLDEEELTASLCGAIGTLSGVDLMTEVKMGYKLPDWGNLLSNPKTAPIPEDTMVQCMLMTKAIVTTAEDTLTALCQYLMRDGFKDEWEAVFYRSIMSSKKQEIAIDNDTFQKRCMEMNWIFTK